MSVINKNNIWKRRAATVAYAATMAFMGFCGNVQLAHATSQPNNSPEFKIIYSFTEPEGQSPSAPILASDGNLYGVSLSGALYGHGAIYRITPANKISVLYTFGSASDGVGANSPLVQASDGYLYGTTRQGGANNDGVVFRVDTSGHYKVLYSFGTSSSDGAMPVTGLTLGTDGNFYGTTELGGNHHWGTIYTITPKGHETVIYRFAHGIDGSYITNPVTRDAAGNLLTVSTEDSTEHNGAAVQVSSKGVLRWATPLGTSIAGAMPSSGLTPDGQGGYIGSLRYSSTDVNGLIYRMSSKGVYSVLYNFKEGSGSGSPTGTIYSAGNGLFYGASYSGGIYSVDLNGHETIVSNANEQASSITLGSDGVIYAATTQEGVDNIGSIFKVTASGEYTNLASLPIPNGADPNSALLQVANGIFLGETWIGGRNGDGTIYSSSEGVVTNVHDFKFTDGAQPSGGLVLDSDGNYYGIATYGGKFAQKIDTGPYEVGGVLFQLGPSGEVTAIHDFSGPDGSIPIGPLVAGSDGALYGVTSFGGANNLGEIYKCTPDHSFHVLHSFDASGGYYASDGLTLGSDGYLYGVTPSGGTDSDGTIYRIRQNGSEFSTIYNFTTAIGNPLGGLVELSPGTFYGLAYGGAKSNGDAYSFATSTETATIIHSFDLAVDGDVTNGRLLAGTDGNLYGGTSRAPSTSPDGIATIFRLAPSGVETTLYTVSNTQASVGYQFSPLTEGSDGNLYGSDGADSYPPKGPNALGLIFQLATELPTGG